MQSIIEAAVEGQSGIHMCTVRYYTGRGKVLFVSKRLTVTVQGNTNKDTLYTH